MARAGTQSDPKPVRRQDPTSPATGDKVQAPVPALRSGLILEILGWGAGPAETSVPGAQPAPPLSKEVTILSGDDVIRARQSARELARWRGFGMVEQTRIATVVSELSRNVYQYAGQGRVTITPVCRNDILGLEIVVEDQGPGIPDLERVMEGGASPDSGRGHGLRGSRRLMDEFAIDSRVGVGTRVTIKKWLKSED
jgi:serine/threonine-protein kinase RsbT